MFVALALFRSTIVFQNILPLSHQNTSKYHANVHNWDADDVERVKTVAVVSTRLTLGPIDELSHGGVGQNALVAA